MKRVPTGGTRIFVYTNKDDERIRGTDTDSQNLSKKLITNG